MSTPAQKRWPDVRGLLPQQGPMCLLTRVVDHGPDGTHCAASVGSAALFEDDRGRVPAWVALEFMAQTAAVHGALSAGPDCAPPTAAFLLGTRSMTLAEPAFESGQTLDVSARPLRRSGDLIALECEVAAGAGRVVARARINVLSFDADGAVAASPMGPG